MTGGSGVWQPFAIFRRALWSVAGGFFLLAFLGPVPRAVAADDPFSGDQWALAKVGAPAAWASSTGAGVRIGIVDTGVDLRHEDLAAKVVAHADCTGSGGCATAEVAGTDDNGHGTHVAGIAAAVTGNGIGVSGMAPNATLVVAKALEADGSGTVADVDEAIRWVVDNGAQVVNLSFGPEVSALGGVGGASIGPAISYAWSRGALPVIAAGNDGNSAGSSNYEDLDALVVGATGPNDTVASYSSAIEAKYGMVAPGGDGDCSGAGGAQRCILSIYFNNNRYALMRGTSMAAPMVSGTAALVLAEGFSRDETVRRLLGSADHSVGCGPRCSGRLDAGAAVDPSRPTPAPALTVVNSGPAVPAADPSVTQADGGAGAGPGRAVGLPGGEPALLVVPPGPAAVPVDAPTVSVPDPVAVVPAPGSTGASVAPARPAVDPSPGDETSRLAAPVEPAGAPAPVPGIGSSEAASPETGTLAAPVAAPDAPKPLLHLRVTSPAGNRSALLGLGVVALLLGGVGRAASVRQRATADPGP